MAGLTKFQIEKIVYKYIGVNDGYLADFSYAKHARFYPEYCDLEIDLNDYEGPTTRLKFIQVLTAAHPRDQAKIINGVIERFPLSDGGKPTTRNEYLQKELIGWMEKLNNNDLIESPTLQNPSLLVHQAIQDAEILIERSGETSGVDRLHTTLHGYLKDICRRNNIGFEEADGITRLLRLVIAEYNKCSIDGRITEDFSRILTSFGGILESLNNLRNQKSVAHANSELLEPVEARLFINATRTILGYLEARIPPNFNIT